MNALIATAAAYALAVSPAAAAAPLPPAPDAARSLATAGPSGVGGLRRGDYGMLLTLEATKPLPLVGGVRETTQVVTAIHIVTDSNGVRAERKTCAVTVSGVPGLADVRVPAKFVRSLPAGDLVFTQTPSGFRADTGVESLGFRSPRAGETYPPPSADAAGVRDDDGDGHPGASLYVDVRSVGAIRLGVTQRSRFWLDGKTNPTTNIARGRVRVPLMQRHLLESDPNLFVLSADVVVDEDSSEFVLFPAEGTVDCDELVRQSVRFGWRGDVPEPAVRGGSVAQHR